MKLTDKQRAALPEIAAGEVTMKRFGTGANRIIGPVAPAVVGKMTSLGLARWPKGPVGDQTLELTDAGRALLEQPALADEISEAARICENNSMSGSQDERHAWVGMAERLRRLIPRALSTSEK